MFELMGGDGSYYFDWVIALFTSGGPSCGEKVVKVTL